MPLAFEEIETRSEFSGRNPLPVQSLGTRAALAGRIAEKIPRVVVAEEIARLHESFMKGVSAPVRSAEIFS
jgi:hypothetical protein